MKDGKKAAKKFQCLSRFLFFNRALKLGVRRIFISLLIFRVSRVEKSLKFLMKISIKPFKYFFEK
jgi:hypothetical protein